MHQAQGLTHIIYLARAWAASVGGILVFSETSSIHWSCELKASVQSPAPLPHWACIRRYIEWISWLCRATRRVSPSRTNMNAISLADQLANA
ncbi:hypothetical protein F5Y07DRAFT_109044 [Xylaria sp. FL0933]|nr:hypothetical protein F5Y07DRAFT_109044 [Xylaria sp. FL0933]